MIPTLYDKFKPWSERGSIYIISDTHFEDDDCKLMDADWITPQEHAECICVTKEGLDSIIEYIRNRDKKNDTII